MYDAGKIVIGIIIFLILMTFPFWYNLVNGVTPFQAPEIATKNIPGKDKCVKSGEYMKTSHMLLLNEWRDTAVRYGIRYYTTADNRKFNISLSNTCLDCHSNEDNFCDRCHNYMGVDPYCWDCHIEPEEPK